MPKGIKRKRQTRRRKIELQRRRQAAKVTERLTGEVINFLPFPEVPEAYSRFLEQLRENSERMIGAKIGAIV